MDADSFASHLDRLRRQGHDDQFIEVKAMAPQHGKKLSSKGLRSLWESVSAFANTAGGTLFLGLSETEGFTPAPGFNAEDIITRLHQGLNSGDRDGMKLSPVPEYTVDTVEEAGASVVVLTVEPLTVNGPCHLTDVGINRGSFKRVGDADRHLNPYEVYELQHRFDRMATDAEAVPDSSMDDLDNDLVETVARHLRSAGSRIASEDNRTWLRRKRIITASGELTLAGLLAFGIFPQQFFPRLFLDVAVHPGTKKGDTPGARFIDRRICEGHLRDVVQDALVTVRKNLRMRHVIVGAEGRDYLEVPEDVIREAISNAVMHRDYSPMARQQAVTIDIFRDRVEVVSPGGFPGPKSSAAEALTDGRAVPRNELLARLLMDIPWPGKEGGVVAESNGSGIPSMFAAMRSAGLPLPEYSVDISQVKVTLRRFGLLDPDTDIWLSGILGTGYTPTDGIALVLARDHGAVSPADLRAQTGHDTDDLRQTLHQLTRRNILVEESDDHFRLPTATDSLGDAEQRVISSLSTTVPASTREISDTTGYSMSAVRRALRTLVDSGHVTATAPPTSRNRKYLLTDAHFRQ